MSVKQKIFISLFVVLTLVYLGFNLLTKPDPVTLAHYHLSLAGARAIIYSVSIPIALIWTLGAYGSLKMKDYSQIIKKSKEGGPMNIISDGLMLLVLAQVLTSVIGTVLTRVEKNHLTWVPTLTIINNYAAVLLTGAALSVIAFGGWKLNELVRGSSRGCSQQIISFLFIALSSIYSYFIIIQPIHTPLVRRIYYMPDWLILLTIAIPYLLFWYLGILGSYFIYNFQKRTKGNIYRGCLGYVAAGIATVVVSSIAVRFLSTISTTISRLKLTPVLFIIYGFLLLLAVGFLLIAVGAKKLRKIEEV
jgi:hypothetical protein